MTTPTPSTVNPSTVNEDKPALRGITKEAEKRLKKDFDPSYGLPDGYEDWNNYNTALKQFLVDEIARAVEEERTKALAAIEEPLREGDGLPDDEIIEDGVREAFVRQTIRNKYLSDKE